MTEQQHHVIADRDKGDDMDAAIELLKGGDRLVYKYLDEEHDILVRIERPVPTTDEPVMLTYEECNTYPLGTVVADASGYWAAHHRHYIKTSENTWASFWQTPTVEQIAEAVKEERNNLSPCPSGYLAWVTTPLSNEQPSPSLPTREQINSAVGEVLFNASNYPRAAMPHILGHDIGPLRNKVTDAVLALFQKGADRG